VATISYAAKRKEGRRRPVEELKRKKKGVSPTIVISSSSVTSKREREVGGGKGKKGTGVALALLSRPLPADEEIRREDPGDTSLRLDGEDHNRRSLSAVEVPSVAEPEE